MILDELEYRATHRIESFYPETGPLRRELYPRHMEFFAAGARHNERLFLGRNRVGKSEAVGAFECVRPAQIAPFSHRRRNSLSPARDRRVPVLEPDEGKLSSPVLRGLEVSNGLRLLGKAI